MLNSLEIGRIARSCKAELRLLCKVGLARLILAGGMPRSGSTLIFNIIRLVLRSDPRVCLSSGWIGDIGTLQPGNTYLIKVHNTNWIRVARAHRIIYSYRDVRDALVSGYRRFGVDPTLETASQWIYHQQKARKYANILIRYETMISDPHETVERIASLFERPVNTAALLAGIGRSNDSQSIPEGTHDATTLFHRDHATDTSTGEWRGILRPSVIAEINKEFEWWFIENGYPVE